MRSQDRQATIHPSIEGLVGLIRAHQLTEGGDATRLREMCRNKIRSYREDAYLDRYDTLDERLGARARWRLVEDFANRGR
jgi:hypothetical protein